MIEKFKLQKLIQNALEEDIGTGDITTAAILTGNETGIAQAIAKSNLIIAGIDVFKEAFLICDERLLFSEKRSDGSLASPGEVIAEISGSLRHILIAERVALNFFQRMCGIATETKRYIEKIKPFGTKILDTRKTAPCLRQLDKYAVGVGGGTNHRFGLFGGVLIKDNHIDAAGGITEAVKRIKKSIPPGFKIEIEVKNLKELEEALASSVDIIMLDNMSTEMMKDAVIRINGKALVEASGNVTLANVRQVAETGVDFISIGSLTHSVTAADISLRIKMK